MPVSPPDWLTKRGGALHQTYDGESWAVVFTTGQQYLVSPRPAEGKFCCAVTQANNGRRLDGNGTYPTEEDAVRGGLEDLRKVLGW